MSGSILDRIANPTVPNINPLDAYSRALSVNNALNQNKLFQAQQAAGEAYQQATDPTTGQVDTGKAQALIAADPRAALAAQPSASSGQALAQAQQNRSGQAQANVAQTIVSLGTLPDSQMTGPTFRAAIGQRVADGSMTQGDAAAAEQDLPPDGSPPAAYRMYVLRHGTQNLATPEGQRLLYGNAVTINNGQSFSGGTQASPAMGAAIVPSGAPVQVYPSRSDLATRVPVGVDPKTGAPLYGPAATVTPPGLAGPAGTPSPLGTGRLPPALRNPASSPQPGQAGTTPAPGTAATAPQAGPQAGTPGGAPTPTGVVSTSLGPAGDAAQQATGAQSATAFSQIADQGQNARAQNGVLGNMLADTSQFTTGPGQDRIKNFQTALQRFAPNLAHGMGITPDAIAANESFDKFAAQLANSQGAGSDARLAVNQAGNPHSSLSPAGIDMIIRQLQGNNDYLAARSNLAANYPNKADRAGFESQVGAKLDPRVFQYQRLTPQQRTTYFNSLQDKNTFKQNYMTARQMNLLGGGNGS